MLHKHIGTFYSDFKPVRTRVRGEAELVKCMSDSRRACPDNLNIPGGTHQCLGWFLLMKRDDRPRVIIEEQENPSAFLHHHPSSVSNGETRFQMMQQWSHSNDGSEDLGWNSEIMRSLLWVLSLKVESQGIKSNQKAICKKIDLRFSTPWAK